MNIAVCVKYVPKCITSNEINRDIGMGEINPADMFAIEESIRLKERYEGKRTIESIGICMGVPKAQQALRKAISMGMDDFFLLSDKSFAGSDTYATSYVLAKAIEKINKFELVICGRSSSDGGTGHVSQELASQINYQCLINVVQIIKMTDTELECKVLEEDGYRIVTAKLPLVISVLKEINEPRVPSVRGIISAQNKDIKVLNREDLEIEPNKCGTLGSHTKVSRVFKKSLKTRLHEDITQEYMQTLRKCIFDAKNNFNVVTHTYSVKKSNTKKCMNEIWVVCQVCNGNITKHSLQLLTKARELLDGNYMLCAVLLDRVLDSSLEVLKHYLISKLYCCQNYTSLGTFDEGQQKMLLHLCREYRPHSVLFCSTTWGRWLAPYIAVQLKTGLTADCINLMINSDTGVLQQIRSVYGDSRYAEIVCTNSSPQMSTVRINVFSDVPIDKVQKYDIVNCPEPALDIRRIISCEKTQAIENVTNLVDSDIVLCGGRGVGNKDNFKLLYQLANMIGGTVGATRYAVDAGWVDYSRQIGQTGICIRPKLYIGFGVSGASEHIVGIRDSSCVVCINNDDRAPLIKNSDYIIKKDCVTIIKELLDSFTEQGGYTHEFH